ncbi:MAG: isoleucine--tRNA ligase [Planctomycetaceae bacterium]|nr:isoleucine--tRNA ligase [Planctomycetaceae bacterium]
MFPAVDNSQSFPDRELEVLRLWQEHETYHKTLAARAAAPPFVFYEGPPTANGMPHPGHCLTRAIKDLFPRYKTMRGYRCERKAGWDTHGLPVEVEVCKELGIHAKEEIEAYGVEPFIHRCQQSVWRYMNEWERLTERLGFWVDLENAYVTYHKSYVESVWWSLKNLFDRDLLYKGHKIVWWWAQGGTALSSGEVGQGYREVADPSVYVKFPIAGPNSGLAEDPKQQVSLLVWTTTPWTLPSNQFVAINPSIDYATLVDSETGEYLVAALDLVEQIAAKTKRNLTIHRKYSGKYLFGHVYEPPFENFGSPYKYHSRQTEDGPSPESPEWRVLEADFVTTESGTGLVHIAPAFGEDDYEVLQRWREELIRVDPTDSDQSHLPSLINCVGPDGKFTDEAPEFVRGRWVKECDKDIIRDLKQRGLLFHQEQYLHDYPFCWRAEEDPLIQYPRESWFIRTTSFRDAMLENNSQIDWLPEHIRDGRFGKFLESNVDWALSRERFWGTPLPIWVCEETGKMEAIGCYDELLGKPGVAGTDAFDKAKEKNPDLAEDLRVHKPYIDEVTYDSPFTKGSRMRRVSEVIDCWYDSGAMPFAQWGYQGEESGPIAEQFARQFPADFISEAIDQTRGWFYSQLAISTMIWGGIAQYPHPFRNCIVLGLMLGEDGQKMSKSKRNYREPNEIFDKYGADALRWYFFANQPPWTSIRYSEQAIKDSVPEFLLRLWNVYSFFTIYANIDGFDPAAELSAAIKSGAAASSPAAEVGAQLTPDQLASAKTYRPLDQRSELDRWILSELHRTAAAVVERMDAYDNFAACAAITEFVDALSNWYVRRSRDRFWAKDTADVGKRDAYWTLYECLVTTAKLVAPFTPFLAESLWQNLVVAPFAPSGGWGRSEAQPPESATGGSLRSSPATPTVVADSVHLCDYPTGNAAAIDEELSARMNLVRHISSLGRQARTMAELKVRQPLARVEVILADTTHQAWLEEHAAVIADELNVKAVEYSDQPEKYVEHEVLPNFKLLGPKLGKLMPKVKGALAKQSGSELLANIRDNGKINLTIDGTDVELTGEEVEVRITAREGWTAANDKGVVVVLATELTEELIAEGLSRDLIRAIQDRRKEIGCEFTDRIEVAVVTESPELQNALSLFGDAIAGETLSAKLGDSRLPGVESSAIEVSGHKAELYVRVTGTAETA